MQANELIRRIQRVIGDPGGSRFSKQEIVDVINVEAQRVAARFPHERRIDTTQESATGEYLITSSDIDVTTMSIQRVFLGAGYEAIKISTAEMERIVEE